MARASAVASSRKRQARGEEEEVIKEEAYDESQDYEDDDDGVENQDTKQKNKKGRGRSNSNNKRSKRDNHHHHHHHLKLMQESGMTDEDRRQLRMDQRALNERMALTDSRVNNNNNIGSDGDDDDDNDKNDFLKQAQKENNKLFEKVRFTREAVLDAENVGLITEKYVQKVDRLVQVPRYDASRLVQKLREKAVIKTGASPYFDWVTFGRECGICFNATPEQVSFMAGAIDQPTAVKEKKKRQARRKKSDESDEEEERPDQIKDKDEQSDPNKLAAVERTMREMKKKLKERSRTVGAGEDVDGVQFLFNPKSFTQTVENIFNFTFLIKRGEAELGIRTEDDVKKMNNSKKKGAQQQQRPGLYVQHRGAANDATANQSVVAFTMQDWKAMCEASGLTKGDLPNRKSK